MLGHKPIIDVNPRRSVEMQEALKQEKKARRTLGLVFPEERRYVERSGSERVNGRLKDEFGGRHVRVRGYDKVPSSQGTTHAASGASSSRAPVPQSLPVPWLDHPIRDSCANYGTRNLIRPSLMDAAYDSIEIWAHCILLGHKPIIDVNPRRSVEMQEALKQEKKARRTLGLVFPEERRYVERSGSERVNGRLKDEFGGRHVRVRGYDKVLAHLMFGMTVLTASQLMRLIVPPI